MEMVEIGIELKTKKKVRDRSKASLLVHEKWY